MNSAAPAKLKKDNTQMDSSVKISIVIPCYQNIDELAGLERALLELHQDLNGNYDLEVVLVDDGSTDGMGEKLETMQPHWPFRSKLLMLTGNFGSYNAFHAGITHCNGDAIIQLHADLQDPPNHIPEMVELWENGFKLVIGQRVKREVGFFPSILPNVFHAFIKRGALQHIPSGGFDLILFDKEIAEVIKQKESRHTNLVYLISSLKHKYATVPISRLKRTSGVSQWSTLKKVKMAIDTALSFSYTPVSIYSFLAIVASLALVGSNFLVLSSSAYSYQTKLLVTATLFALLVLVWGISLLVHYAYRSYQFIRKEPNYVIDRVISS